MENKKYFSPDTGAPLIKTDDENIYFDSYNKLKYYIDANDKIIKLTSPINGLPLKKNDDGIYEAIHQKYILDKNRGVIPQFIPDDTQENAHIEGNYLVGNITGRKFPITEDGKIIMPFDPIILSPNASKEEIKKYFEERKMRQLLETQEEIDTQIEKDQLENRKAIEKVIKERESKKLKETIPQEKKELDEIRNSIQNGQITLKNIKRLLELGDFSEEQKEILLVAFAETGRINYEEDNPIEEKNNIKGV